MSAPRFFPDEISSESAERNLQCGLCPKRCLLAPGRSGRCKVRFNRGGKPEIPFYGFITSLAMDPIEKKPLYHFRPGTEVLSIGFAGCNLNCPFCQNWHISQNTDISGRNYSPTEIIAAAKQSSARSLAYTYSEPLVHIEFLLDCMKEAREAGIANVLVSNGCVNSEAAEEILKLTDAANIDLKSFSPETYKSTLGGDLEAVLGFIRMAAEKKVHLEITTLIVPGLNDSKAELDKCADFIAGLETGGNAIPWHLSAYHPDWKWKTPPTSPALINETALRARKRLPYVYSGNIAGEKNETSCPHCGKTLVDRRGYRVDTSGLSLKKENGKLLYFCAACGKSVPVKF